jgi:iron complex outermembrane receptor protein
MKTIFLFSFIFISLTLAASAQAPGNVLTGSVKLKESGHVIPNATVTLSELRRSAQTDAEGNYRFEKIPVGRYELIVHVDRMTDAVKTIEVKSGENNEDLEVMISGISEQVTVTASGSPESINNAYQSVSTVGSLKLAERNSLSIGEALENEPGVAKRSFGPGTGRPVIRGFDGDRVLVLRDGLRVGGIASQSGDEVEPIDVLSLDRVEVVKGPATLLYGSNAIGGVVNGISSNDVYQRGLSGYFTGFGGSNNWQAGASGGLKFGVKNFLLFANGGGQKANDYRTPLGTVLNSYARNGNVSGGAGWFPQKGWLAFNYSFDKRRHAIPVEPDEIDFEYLKERRHAYEAKGGFRELGSIIESGDFAVSYNSYRAREFEFESDENVTELESVAFNKNLNYRANFNHRRHGKFSGTFGFSGFTRDYESVGAEAPAPRTKQNSFAAYALERIDFERVGFQFGGRIEQNGYDPEGDLRSRNFVGFSGGAGVRVPLWNGGSFVVNYQHSFRAPALEELYNHGPHPGILVWDIGNPNLKAEQGDGIDISLRHSSDRFRLSGGIFYYNIRNFVYTAFTGETDEESNLPIIEYAQNDARYFGGEASLEAKLIDTLWFNAKADFVRADLTELDKPLPRIPPVRGTLGLDWRFKGFSVRPEVVMAAKQDRIFENETTTPGYAVFNVDTSYTIFAKSTAHVFSFSGYNLTDKLYLNHLSFLKGIAPEIGRGARLTYALRF